MIRINLLPVREVRRRLAARRQLQLGLVLIVASIAGGAWFYTVQRQELAERRNELGRLSAELQALDKIIKEVQQFQEKKSVLEKKVEVIGGLKKSQRRPARLLDEVSRSLPEQVWLISLKESGQAYQILGRSFDNVGIAAFMENLERSVWFEGVELVESKSEALQGRQVLAFTVTARLTGPAASKKKEATS
jgi:type IV pilus assembly protein PilN